jgi:hypothetical protein
MMMGVTDRSPRDENAIYLDQLITKRDLVKFQEELLLKISNLLQKPIESQNQEWLKSAEVRKLLKISPGTLQSLRISGVLPYTRLGGSLYYKRSDLEIVMEKRK